MAKSIASRLDADELDTLKKVLLEYLVPRDMVTKISYSENMNDLCIKAKGV